MHFSLMRANSTTEQIYQFLRRAHRPVPIGVVIDYVLSIKEYKGFTPRKTVSSIIQRSQRIKTIDGYCVPILEDEDSI